MKILYAIQGTGNGHISRARDIVPVLSEYAELDILVSGIQADVELGYPIKYKFRGASLIFGKRGGVDVFATYWKSNMRQLLKDINKLPIHEYGLVISDFEPVSAWACRLSGRPCIGLSHQSAVLHEKAPKPKKIDPVGKLILKKYAPVTASYGFHFQAYAEGIFTPVIRQAVRNLEVSNHGHYAVYLPAYDDQRLLKALSKFQNVRWEVFSKHTKKPYRFDNISVQPVSNEAFLKSMSKSAGVLCGAGFETPAEALFLGKKLMAIPMKGQYEQQCNAAALSAMGVPVIKNLKKKYHAKIAAWLASNSSLKVDYPDNTREVIKTLLEHHGDFSHNFTAPYLIQR